MPEPRAFEIRTEVGQEDGAEDQAEKGVCQRELNQREWMGVLSGM